MEKDVYQKSLVSRAKDVFKGEGLVAVGSRAGAKVRNLFFRSNSAFWFARDLVDFPVSGTERTGDPQVSGSFSRITPAELEKLLLGREDLAWAVDPRELSIAKFLKHPWTCWKLDGETVAFCKVGTGRVFIVDFEKPISLPGELAFLSDVYVFPRARGKGIGRELLLATMKSLERDSVSVLSCHIPRNNLVSTRLFLSLGFRSFGRIHFVRILGLPLFSMRPEAMLEKMVPGSRRHRAGFHAFLK